MAKFNAIASAALGIISLCGSIFPICGAGASLLGIMLGYSSLKTERSTTAVVGIALSILGLLITIVYAMFLLISKGVQ